ARVGRRGRGRGFPRKRGHAWPRRARRRAGAGRPPPRAAGHHDARGPPPRLPAGAGPVQPDQGAGVMAWHTRFSGTIRGDFRDITVLIQEDRAGAPEEVLPLVLARARALVYGDAGGRDEDPYGAGVLPPPD